jgi:hypothetical protein
MAVALVWARTERFDEGYRMLITEAGLAANGDPCVHLWSKAKKEYQLSVLNGGTWKQLMRCTLCQKLKDSDRQAYPTVRNCIFTVVCVLSVFHLYYIHAFYV